jgi:hypothetical protein
MRAALSVALTVLGPNCSGVEWHRSSTNFPQRLNDIGNRFRDYSGPPQAIQAVKNLGASTIKGCWCFTYVLS